MEEFYEKAKMIDDDIYVIGGASIYEQFIDKADELILTEIDDECLDADVYFPSIKYEDYKRIVLKENLDNIPRYRHVKYIKIKK